MAGIIKMGLRHVLEKEQGLSGWAQRLAWCLLDTYKDFITWKTCMNGVTQLIRQHVVLFDGDWHNIDWNGAGRCKHCLFLLLFLFSLCCFFPSLICFIVAIFSEMRSTQPNSIVVYRTLLRWMSETSQLLFPATEFACWKSLISFMADECGVSHHGAVTPCAASIFRCSR